MIEIKYRGINGNVLTWTCSEDKLESLLEKFEYKGLEVIDWVYVCGF
jgi:hypothetical protein